MLQDLRYGARMLGRRPGFTFVAVISLALGIGANTAIFSLISAVLLKPLPFAEPDRLVMVWEDATFAGFPRNTPAPANYADWKTQQSVFEEMAALDWRSFNLIGDGEPEKVQAYGVTANFFPLLGIEPALGRSFLPEEDQPGADRVVILSHGLWQRRFGGRVELVGKEILLNGEKYTVVGVMPAGFQFLEPYIRLWVPLAFSAEELANRGSHYLTVIARMKPGVPLAQAQADIQTITQRIARDYPEEAGRLGSHVLPLREQLAGDVRRPLMVLLLAVAFVLLIACVNITGLLLARAASRSREMAVRTALGAGRARIVRQLLTESVLLAGAGGALGLLIAAWSFRFLQQLIPSGLALSTRLNLDAGALGYTLLIAVLTGLIFGLAPALQAAKTDMNELLKQGSARSGLGEGRGRLRHAMVVSQIALALILLVTAGLLIQTFYRLRYLETGFRPDHVLTLKTVLPRQQYDTHARRVAFYNEVLDRVQPLPGVISAGYTTSVPLEWKGGTSGFLPEGRELQPALSYDAIHRQVSANYLKAMGIPLREGRYFEPGESALSQPVAIINETMARQYWPDESAIGKRFKMGDPDSDVPWFTIAGVVGDVRQMGLDLPVKAEMYLLYRQVTDQPWFAPRDLVIRTEGEPMNLVGPVKNIIHSIDAGQPVSNIRTLNDILDEEVSHRRLGTTLLVIFALLALLLAGLGIYGVLSYFVAQHRPEIGVRLAMGARAADIFKMVLGKGMRLALSGVAAGLAGSLLLARLVSGLLFGIGAMDPFTLVATSGLLLGVALFACYIPARRALKIAPLEALRQE